MKKLFKSLLVGSMVFSLANSSLASILASEAEEETTAEQAEETNKDNAVEQNVVKWNYGTSGNVLVTIAEEKGFFEEEGITIEPIHATANADAMALIASGKADIASNSGTSNPLQQISSGVDMTVFGGHMVNGAMPVIAKKGTEWKGVESLVGKKFACNPQYFAFTGALLDLGYEPFEDVEFVSYSDYNDAIAAVVQGEVDYALLGTGQNFSAKTMDEIEIVTYQSDVMPNYSCCRLVALTDYVNENPNTIKAVLRALIRAQEFYENNKDEAVKLQAKAINTDEEYVKAYMLDDHYDVHVDPLKSSVIRAWDILDKTGFLSDEAKDINVEDHINTQLYKEALDQVMEEHYDEDPEFYDNMVKFFEEFNQ